MAESQAQTKHGSPTPLVEWHHPFAGAWYDPAQNHRSASSTCGGRFPYLANVVSSNQERPLQIMAGIDGSGSEKELPRGK